MGIALVAVSFLPLYAFLPACAYWESRPYLPNGHHLNQDIGFFVVGSYVRFDVFVDGGDGEITAQVRNMQLDRVTTEYLVEGSGFIAFGVPKNDYYGLYLRNTHVVTFPTNNNKQILIKVYYYFYNLLFLASGGVIVGLGAALIVSYHCKVMNRRVEQARAAETKKEE